MKSPKRVTITAALPYTNGPVHIGHLAGVYVPADIYARYLRLTGNEVAFVCGSDEHGVPITLKAKAEGTTPQAVVDKYHEIIKSAFDEFGISFDNYSRTSAEIHHKTASEFFQELYQNGKFIEETAAQLYDEQAAYADTEATSLMELGSEDEGAEENWAELQNESEFGEDDGLDLAEVEGKKITIKKKLPKAGKKAKTMSMKQQSKARINAAKEKAKKKVNAKKAGIEKRKKRVAIRK